jgi:hypothetical protein
MNAGAEIDELIERLELAAERLRASELPAEEATRLIDECADVAVQASAELERRARGVQSAPPEGQEPLTGPQQDSLL